MTSENRSAGSGIPGASALTDEEQLLALERKIDAGDPYALLEKAELEHQLGLAGAFEAGNLEASRARRAALRVSLQRLHAAERRARAIIWGCTVGLLILAVSAQIWRPSLRMERDLARDWSFAFDAWLRERQADRLLAQSFQDRDRGHSSDDGAAGARSGGRGDGSADDRMSHDRQDLVRRAESAVGIRHQAEDALVGASRAELEMMRHFAGAGPNARNWARYTNPRSPEVDDGEPDQAPPDQAQRQYSDAPLSASFQCAEVPRPTPTECPIEPTTRSEKLSTEQWQVATFAFATQVAGGDCEGAAASIEELWARYGGRDTARRFAYWYERVGSCWMSRMDADTDGSDWQRLGDEAARSAWRGLCLDPVGIHADEAYGVLLWTEYRRAYGTSWREGSKVQDTAARDRATVLLGCYSAGLEGLAPKLRRAGGPFLVPYAALVTQRALLRWMVAGEAEASIADFQDAMKAAEDGLRLQTLDPPYRQQLGQTYKFALLNQLEVLVATAAEPKDFEPVYAEAMRSEHLDQDEHTTAMGMRLMWLIQKGDIAGATTLSRSFEARYLRGYSMRSWDWTRLRVELGGKAAVGASRRVIALTEVLAGPANSGRRATLRGVISWLENGGVD